MDRFGTLTFAENPDRKCRLTCTRRISTRNYVLTELMLRRQLLDETLVDCAHTFGCLLIGLNDMEDEPGTARTSVAVMTLEVLYD